MDYKETGPDCINCTVTMWDREKGTFGTPLKFESVLQAKRWAKSQAILFPNLSFTVNWETNLTFEGVK